MYRLALTSAERSALAGIADRYASAAVLYDGMVPADDRDGDELPVNQARPYDLPEHVARAFREACDQEDGHFVPCAGGSLAAKLHELLDDII